MSIPDQTPKSSPLAISLFWLVRPRQWAKSVFVLIGPLYGLSEPGRDVWSVLPTALLAAAAFALVSSACYIVNDLVDVKRDRQHPRKKNRPIASGAVTPSQAASLAAILILGTLGILALLPPGTAWWTFIALVVYTLNVVLYSVSLKHVVMADVISLAMGFVLRVLGGCAATGTPPTTWLLNTSFFLAMFLAFCKRLGERRLMRAVGGDAVNVRAVQSSYTDDLLKMSVVVTAVATLVTYALYVQAHEAGYTRGFNLLWLTMLPATYGLLRAIVVVERGEFDDPTEMASRDWRIQLAGGLFVGMVVGLTVWRLGGSR